MLLLLNQPHCGVVCSMAVFLHDFMQALVHIQIISNPKFHPQGPDK